MVAALTLAMLVAPGTARAADAPPLPPAIGADEPAAEPAKGDDGIYHQKWFVQSFFDLREDFAEAKAQGKRLAIIFEQRGCIYCVKMHTEVLKKRYINDYVRENFAVIQFDMWGSREVTDFDGQKMPEKKLAERWGIMFTPTVILFKEDIGEAKGQWGQPLEVVRMNLGIGPGTFYDMFSWIFCLGITISLATIFLVHTIERVLDIFHDFFHIFFTRFCILFEFLHLSNKCF